MRFTFDAGNGTPARPIRLQEHLISTQYYAPRGKERLLMLGEQIAYSLELYR